MHVRLRFFRLCTVVVATLGWTMTAAASAVIADPMAQIQEPIGSSADDGRLVKTPAGPPANLDAGVFRRVVDAMWRDSLTFRRQCHRLGVERGLVVKLLSQTSHRQSSVRASTEMSRKNGTLTLARVVVFRPWMPSNSSRTKSNTSSSSSTASNSWKAHRLARPVRPELPTRPAGP